MTEAVSSRISFIRSNKTSLIKLPAHFHQSLLDSGHMTKAIAGKSTTMINQTDTSRFPGCISEINAICMSRYQTFTSLGNQNLKKRVKTWNFIKVGLCFFLTDDELSLSPWTTSTTCPVSIFPCKNSSLAFLKKIYVFQILNIKKSHPRNWENGESIIVLLWGWKISNEHKDIISRRHPLMSSQKQDSEALTGGAEGQGWHFWGPGQEHARERWSQSHWPVLLEAIPVL